MLIICLDFQVKPWAKFKKRLKRLTETQDEYFVRLNREFLPQVVEPCRTVRLYLPPNASRYPTFLRR
jgi:hypothetical protein